jgi:CelD/BcsL family acetyltransferase involved in cellulose biosynthesis
MRLEGTETAGAAPPVASLTAVTGVAEIRIFGDVVPLQRAWRSFEKTAAGHVFQSFDFVSAWLATVGRARGIEPLIVVGFDGAEEILFILPFCVTKRLGRRHLEWLGAEHADYNCGLFDREFLANRGGTQLTEAVTALLSDRADLCDFRRQPEALDGLPNPFASFSALRHCHTSHETHLGTSFESYYLSKRDSSSRRHDRGKLKRLEALGDVRVKTDLTSAETERAMAVLFEEKERNLGERGAGGFFRSDAVKRFYLKLADRPHPDGPCHLATVECGGEIVAVNWGLVHGKRYYYVMHAFASQSPAARFSPGRLLLHGLMQWCIGSGIEIFDFTIGDEAFKRQWCEVSAPLSDSVAALNGRGAALAVGLRSAKAARRFIKDRPALRSVAQEIRRRLPSGRAAAG